MKHFSLPYFFLKQLVILLRAIFYRRYSIVGLENIPKDKPVILAPNHQNAFMDPIMVGIALKRQTYFLVRADVFKKKLVSKILHSLKMMPVYRMRDGVDSMDKNEDTFNKCYQILKDKQMVLLFPEGNHGNKKQLRPLKKGAGRIAFGAESLNDFSLDIQVVPVAINYGNFTETGSTLQVTFAKPFPLSDFKEEYIQDPNKALVSFKNRLTEAMKPTMADWSDEYYTFIENIRKIFEIELSDGTFNQDVELASTKKIYKNLNDAKVDCITKTDLSTKFLDLLKKNNLKPFAFWNSKFKAVDIFLSWLIILVTSPIWLYGIFNNVLPYKLSSIIVPKLIKDDHFYSSFRIAFMLVLFPLFYGIQFCMALFLFGKMWALLYLISLPFIGFLSLRMWYFILLTYYRTQFNRKFDTKEVKEALSIRQELKSFLQPFL